MSLSTTQRTASIIKSPITDPNRRIVAAGTRASGPSFTMTINGDPMELNGSKMTYNKKP